MGRVFMQRVGDVCGFHCLGIGGRGVRATGVTVAWVVPKPRNGTTENGSKFCLADKLQSTDPSGVYTNCKS